MTPQVSSEQLEALKAAAGTGPIRVVDPVSQQEYVLLRADLFDNLQATSVRPISDDWYPLIAELLPDDWEDPAAYDSLRKTS